MNWQEKITKHQSVFDKMQAMEPEVTAVGQVLIDCLRHNGTVFAAGNGGSAADAQHFAAELTGRFVNERRPLAGIALTTDTSALTAIANDYGYAEVFARQLGGLSRRGDVFIGISTSGNSENIVRAIEVAKEKSVTTVALSGRDGGKMKALCDYSLIIPCDITAHIQEAHIFTLHHLCEMIDDVMVKA